MPHGLKCAGSVWWFAPWCYPKRGWFPSLRNSCLWLGCLSHPKGLTGWSACSWTVPPNRWLSLVPWWGQYRFSPCCRLRKTALWTYFLPYSFFVCKVKYQRVIPWYANRWQTVQKHPTSVKSYLFSGNDLKTVLFLCSAFYCVLRFFILSSFVTVTTLMLRRLASFLPFFEVIPAFYRKFAALKPIAIIILI